MLLQILLNNNLSEQKNTVKSQSEITVFSFILQDAL